MALSTQSSTIFAVARANQRRRLSTRRLACDSPIVVGVIHELVIHALRELADEHEQRRLWLSSGPPEVSSFDECWCRLFDDSGLITSLEKQQVVFTREIDRHLLQLDALLKDMGNSRAPSEVLDDPKLKEVRSFAKFILREILDASSNEDLLPPH